MNEAEVRQILERSGAVLSGHFRLSSGRHSDTYVQKQRVFEQPRLTMSLAEALRHRFPSEAFDTVVSPALGAITFGFAVAHAANARFLFAERHEGAMAIRRGQHLGRGNHVLIVEDVVTTGGSAAEVIECVEATGAYVVAVGALVDRSNSQPRFAFEPLVRVDARDYDPDSCPMCRAGDPIDSPGSKYA